MMRRSLILCLLAAVVAAVALAADLPDAWHSWRYSRTLPAGEPGSRYELLLPEDVFLHSENHLADLRVIDDRGAEVPFVLITDRPSVQTESRSVTLRERSYVPGQYTQVILDLGQHAAFHNRVQVETPESDFILWVEVAVSDDARTWRIVNARAPISRFRKETLQGNQTIRYSDTNARYLRLRIFEKSREFPVTGASVAFSTGVREATRARLSAALTPDAARPATLSRWSTDLGTDQIPVNEVVFETSQPEFFRAVRILTSEDSKEWRFAAGGEIYRFRVGEKLEESLRVAVSEYWRARYWRVEVVNGNDAPLENMRPALARYSAGILIIPEPSRSYRLLYGNARAGTPEYDLARTLPSAVTQTLAPRKAALGPEETTSNYADPRPFTERHPALLWVALGVAIILLGYASLRSLGAAPANRA
jgi:hypothetical protein